MIIDDETVVVIDQPAITKLCPDFPAMAREVHRQIGYDRGEVDLWAVAEALGIREYLRLPEIGNGGKGTWVHDLASGFDLILLEERLGYIRSRWTLTHEIAHILIPHHEVSILGVGQNRRPNPVYEAEANELARQLIFPENEVLKFCEPFPHLQNFIDGCLSLEVTLWQFLKQAVALSPIPFAAIKSRSQTISNQLTSLNFAELALSEGDTLPICRIEEEMQLTLWEDTDPSTWLKQPVQGKLSVQTLWQDFDESITILAFDASEDPNLQHATEWALLTKNALPFHKQSTPNRSA